MSEQLSIDHLPRHAVMMTIDHSLLVAAAVVLNMPHFLRLMFFRLLSFTACSSNLKRMHEFGSLFGLFCQAMAEAHLVLACMEHTDNDE